MKIVSRLIAALSLVALTGSVFAQSVSVGSVVGQKGNQVVLEPSFTAGAQEVDIVQFLVTFANPTLANFSAVTVAGTCGGTLGTNNQCVVSPSANAFQVIVSNGTNAMPTGILASITFTIDGAAAAGDVALVVDPTSIVIGRDGAAANPPVPVSDGTITISDGPQPIFTGTPAGLAMATEQGLADPTGSLTVTNTGQATSLLTGTCSLLGGGSPEITMSNGGFTDIAVGAGGSVVGVSCSAVAAGSFAATLSCDHNDRPNTPTEYRVTCDIAPPGAAMYSSVPAPGATIEMTPNGDVPTGSTVPDQVLTITNAATDANDNDLALDCSFAGGGDITASDPGSTTLAPTASTSVTFSCSAATVAAHSGTYTCNYGTDGSGGTADGTATYTVNCGVREAASDILEAPISGTALSILVPLNGTGQTSVNFSEILDEGVDATIDSCSFGTAVFSVVTAIPATVTAGTTVNVAVSGTDPATGEISFADTLTCAYTDSDSAPGTASWPITMTVLAQPIPTLSVWGLMLMILTLMGLGGMVIRSRVRS